MSAAHDTERPRLACPCCGFLTLNAAPSGTYRICEVCYWEDDGLQFEDPDRTGGANVVSLNRARENFRRVGASEPRFLELVRSPYANEHP